MARKTSLKRPPPTNTIVVFALDWLTSLVLFLPALPTSAAQKRLLYPLLSAEPVNSLDGALLLLVGAAAVVLLGPSARAGKSTTGWEHLVVLQAILLFASSAIVQLLKPLLLSLELDTAVWIGRLLLELPSAMLQLDAGLGSAARTYVTNGGRMNVRELLPALLSVLVAIKGDSLLFSWSPCHELYARGALLLFAPCLLALVRPFALTSNRNALLGITALASLLAVVLAQMSSHCPLALHPRDLTSSNSVTILASTHSVTGLITTAEYQLPNGGHSLRYMRADHSLLGGLWTGHARERLNKENPGLGEHEIEVRVVEEAESIYSTFLLQEIVRLVKKPGTKEGAVSLDTGLIIGLGVGIAARSFHNSGSNITIVEIDPVVYDQATRFFGVPAQTGGGAYLEDARKYLTRDRTSRFDFAVHDVFSGGSLPLPLFTLECLLDLKAVMKATGRVVINYVGQFSPSAASPTPANRPIAYAILNGRVNEGGVTNMVILCSVEDAPIEFRKGPFNTSGTLSASLRERVFNEFSKHEIDLSRFRPGGRADVPLPLRDGESAAHLAAAELQGARLHHKTMRSVFPREVWAAY